MQHQPRAQKLTAREKRMQAETIAKAHETFDRVSKRVFYVVSAISAAAVLKAIVYLSQS